MVLNIAEGNGRYAQLDHRRFLGIANRASIRLAGLWREDEILETLLQHVEVTAPSRQTGPAREDARHAAKPRFVEGTARI